MITPRQKQNKHFKPFKNILKHLSLLFLCLLISSPSIFAKTIGETNPTESQLIIPFSSTSCQTLETIVFPEDICNQCIGEIAIYESGNENYLVYFFDNTFCADVGNEIFDCDTGEFYCSEGGFTPEPNTCNDFFANATKLETIWSKANNCGTGPNCDDVQVITTPSSELQGTVQISGLNAPIQIVKIFSENWDLLFECNNDCSGQVIFPAPYIGKYIVQVQMYTENWEFICQTDNIEVEVEINTDCASNLLIDADGDGVCEYEDCDDNDPNIGARQPVGIACDDNDASTVNDEIQSDGCTCQGTPEACDFLENIDFADLCNQCVREVATYELDGELYYVYFDDFTTCPDLPILVYTCSDGELFCTIGGFTPVPSTCNDFFNNATKLETIWKKEDNCGTAPNCDDVQIVRVESLAPLPGTETYEIIGLTAPIEIIKIFNRITYEQVYECTNDCVEGYNIDLQEGQYVMQIQMYTENWEWICGKDVEFDVVTTDPPAACDFLENIDFADLCNQCVREVATYALDGELYYVYFDDYTTCADFPLLVYTCSDGELFCTIGGLTPEPNTCNDFLNNATKLETIWKKEDNCGTAPNCDDVQIVRVESLAPLPGTETYEIIGLTAPIEIIKIFNRITYEQVYECTNDCVEGYNIDLQEGQYVMQIQMYTENWEWICGKDVEFDVVTTDPPAACDFLENIDFADLCNQCVREVATYILDGELYYVYFDDYTTCADFPLLVYTCSDGELFCTIGGLTPEPNTCNDFLNNATKLETIWKKEDNCNDCIITNEIYPVCGSDGVTYGNPSIAECAGVFSWTPGACPTTTPDCNNVTVQVNIGLQDTYEGLGVEGLNAPIEIVKIYDEDWNKVYECTGDCANPTVLPLSDISGGLYRVQVQMYTEDWQSICTTDFLEVTVPNNAGSRTGGNFIDEKSITLFPNPVLHTLQLSTKNLQGKKGSIQIFNTFGQQVANLPQKEFNQTYESIDVSGYQNGLYFMTINVKNRKAISKRFLVEKME